MRRLLAFTMGVVAVFAGRALQPGPPGDPLPGASEVRDSIRRLGREAPSAQGAAFADSRIDETEYRDAVSARVACLRSRTGAFIEIVGPAPLAGGRLLTWHYRVPGDGADAVTESDRLCAAEVSGSIERAWKLEVVPQGQDRRREVAQLAACLRYLGVPLQAGDTRSVLSGAVDASVPVGDCVDEHAVLFDL